MQPNSEIKRRVHSAEFKAKVLAQCREPGVSVASVALANGLNANLIHKWQVGRGLKRSGLTVAESTSSVAPLTSDPESIGLPPMQFVPVGVVPLGGLRPGGAAAGAMEASAETASIRVELRCGDASLAVQWPLLQAPVCSSWLAELAGAILRR